MTADGIRGAFEHAVQSAPKELDEWLAGSQRLALIQGKAKHELSNEDYAQMRAFVTHVKRRTAWSERPWAPAPVNA